MDRLRTTHQIISRSGSFRYLDIIFFVVFRNQKNWFKQIHSFRDLRSDHGHITHNFRPLQPIGDRKVFYNTERDGYFDKSTDVIQKPIIPRKSSNSNKNSSMNLTFSISTTMFTLWLLFLVF